MLQTGLVSISFRNLTPEEIIKLASEAGLQGIEWGADIHVLPGDTETAQTVGKMTRDAGMEVFAYGSYYRPGEHEVADFAPVLASAKALGAPVIRVWAGAKWSWRADEAYVQKVVQDTQAICDMAAKEGIAISYEYHGWSLTDNRFSAITVHQEIGRENMALYWQPNFCLTREENILALRMVLPRMRDVHVFHWICPEVRQPLEDGTDLWREAINIIRTDGKPHRLMLEFFKDNSIEQFRKDAQTLKNLIQQS